MRGTAAFGLGVALYASTHSPVVVLLPPPCPVLQVNLLVSVLLILIYQLLAIRRQLINLMFGRGRARSLLHPAPMSLALHCRKRAWTHFFLVWLEITRLTYTHTHTHTQAHVIIHHSHHHCLPSQPLCTTCSTKHMHVLLLWEDYAQDGRVLPRCCTLRQHPLTCCGTAAGQFVRFRSIDIDISIAGYTPATYQFNVWPRQGQELAPPCAHVACHSQLGAPY